jgi:hypothetical protein
MKRDLDITRLILSDRMNNRMRADILYTTDKDNMKAKIALFPNTLGLGLGGITPAFVSSDKDAGYPVPLAGAVASPLGLGLGVGAVGVKPAGVLLPGGTGTQVYPTITPGQPLAKPQKFNLEVNPANFALAAVSPTPALFLANKNLKQ